MYHNNLFFPNRIYDKANTCVNTVALEPGVEKYLCFYQCTDIIGKKKGESAQSFSPISCTNNTDKNKQENNTYDWKQLKYSGYSGVNWKIWYWVHTLNYAYFCQILS